MFGYLRYVDEQGRDEALSIYGPEPLVTPAEELADRLKTPKTRKVKAALLDQTAIAGVGNIYADEACFRAGIRPTRRLGSLTADDRLRLAREVKKVLAQSLAQKGTSAVDYVDTTGQEGGFLKFLRVYGREEQPCRTCKTPIKKITLVGRGTHYCPRCQS
jgi:formamidopyrimidine-DNA glycosylase